MELTKHPWVLVASLCVLVLLAGLTRNVGILVVPLLLGVTLVITRGSRSRGDGRLFGTVIYVGAVSASLVFVALGIRYLMSGDETRYAVGVVFILGWGWAAYKLLAPALTTMWKSRSPRTDRLGLPEAEAGLPETADIGKHEAG